MIAGNKNIFIIVISGKITASHSVYGSCGCSLKSTVRKYIVGFHTIVGYGIKILSVMGYAHI